MPGAVRILLVGVEHGELSIAANLAREAGADVVTAAGTDAALDMLRRRDADMMMIDVGMDIAGMMRALRAERFVLPVFGCGVDAPAERAVAAIRAGARDYLPLPAERELIVAAIASISGRDASLFIGDHPAIRRAQAFATAIAAGDAPLLIVGEPGAGKEALAREIHRQSARRAPLLVIECAGVPAEVLESEMFGHEAGAFPGAAARRIGRIEGAAGGTVVLREIGALAPVTQARLMRLLAERRFARIGGDQPVPVEARLIATTSINLHHEVTADRFRADLLLALRRALIDLPPLRERGDDRVALARHFARTAAPGGAELDDGALEAIAAYRWPGNVRELKDSIERAALLTGGRAIGADDLTGADGAPLATPRPTQGEPIRLDWLVGHTVEDVERELILRTLERCQGNRTSASHILGISVRTMRNKLRSFIEAGIPVSPAL